MEAGVLPGAHEYAYIGHAGWGLWGYSGAVQQRLNTLLSQAPYPPVGEMQGKTLLRRRTAFSYAFLNMAIHIICNFLSKGAVRNDRCR